VTRRLIPGGLRAQLAIAIVLVTALGIGASFVALYSGIGSQLQSQLDTDLRTQAAEWNQFRLHANLSTSTRLERTAKGFISSQRYHAEALVFVVEVNGGSPVTDDTELLTSEVARERNASNPAGLLTAPAGLATVSVAEAGKMRVLTQPIKFGGRGVGILRVAGPLRSVQRAQSSLLRTFLFVGAGALLLAAAVGLGLARLITAPLRRMTGVAAAVDAGDLSLRARLVGGRGELRVLSDAFDHMLERLERAFKRQRDFVSDASHELRTPLSVLRAQVELVDRETDKSRRHEATATLLCRLDELDRLVGDMLTLASAEAGQLVEPRPIDLDEFFEDLRRDLPLFGERDFQLQPVDGTLEADPDRLTQVLRNLVRNAVAHTDPGDRVTVIARARDGRLEISVSDTGPGIPPDQLEQVFARFHRLDHSRSRDRGGSGLGLAIARAIVEAHGGRIHAESPPGQGAAFVMELPGYQAAR
jgi:two-component system, OmpR family, sensor kinase